MRIRTDADSPWALRWLHLCTPDERLAAPVGQAAPEPFERPVIEVAQPQRADNQLQSPDGQHHKKELIELQLGKVVQAVAEEEKRADDGLHDVIRERHLP